MWLTILVGCLLSCILINADVIPHDLHPHPTDFTHPTDFVTQSPVTDAPQQHVSDFDNLYKEYQFIYHDIHDLVVIVHGQQCYYVHVPDSGQEHYAEPQWSTNIRNLTESFLIHELDVNRDQTVRPTTLDDMRNQFSDLLANYHCTGKQIFTLTPRF